MKTKYIKPSVEVFRMKTTSLLAGSLESNFSGDPVTDGSQVLSKGHGGIDLWDDEDD